MRRIFDATGDSTSTKSDSSTRMLRLLRLTKLLRLAKLSVYFKMISDKCAPQQGANRRRISWVSKSGVVS